MKFIPNVWLALLASAFTLNPFAAIAKSPDLSPASLIRVCASDSDTDLHNCESYYHGVVEPFWIRSVDPKQFACRETRISGADLTQFLAYAKTKSLPDTAEGFALIISYLFSPPGAAAHVPCAHVEGAWSVSQLSSLCKADHSDGSPCSFYITGLLGTTSVQDAIAGRQQYCPKANGVQPEGEVIGYFAKWFAADPTREKIPAADGFIAAMAQAYPC